MGWSSGSELADRIWSNIVNNIPEEKRKDVAKELIDAFERYDCDTIYETELYEFVYGKEE